MRAYDRLTGAGGQTAILMDAPPGTGEDVRPFVRIATFLRAAGLSAPEILAEDAPSGLLLIEDFGDALFADLMAADPDRQLPLYRAAADVLLALRAVDPPDLQVCDAHWLTSMLDPVWDWYAPETDRQAKAEFLALFDPLARQVAETRKVLMLRDFHAQNLLLLPDRDGVRRVGILDFQDAMLAHPAYDLVSILQDARRDVDPGIEAAIVDYYLKSADSDPEPFRRSYAVLGLQRNLRILGIFARLCLRDGKAAYVDLIPRVWGYVTRNLTQPDLAPLAPALSRLLPEPDPDFLNRMKKRCPKPPTP